MDEIVVFDPLTDFVGVSDALSIWVRVRLPCVIGHADRVRYRLVNGRCLRDAPRDPGIRCVVEWDGDLERTRVCAGVSLAVVIWVDEWVCLTACLRESLALAVIHGHDVRVDFSPRVRFLVDMRELHYIDAHNGQSLSDGRRFAVVDCVLACLDLNVLDDHRDAQHLCGQQRDSKTDRVGAGDPLIFSLRLVHEGCSGLPIAECERAGVIREVIDGVRVADGDEERAFQLERARQPQCEYKRSRLRVSVDVALGAGLAVSIGEPVVQHASLCERFSESAPLRERLGFGFFTYDPQLS